MKFVEINLISSKEARENGAPEHCPGYIKKEAIVAGMPYTGIVQTGINLVNSTILLITPESSVGAYSNKIHIAEDFDDFFINESYSIKEIKFPAKFKIESYFTLGILGQKQEIFIDSKSINALLQIPLYRKDINTFSTSLKDFSDEEDLTDEEIDEIAEEFLKNGKYEIWTQISLNGANVYVPKPLEQIEEIEIKECLEPQD